MKAKLSTKYKHFCASKLLSSIRIQKENGSVFQLKLYFKVISNQCGTSEIKKKTEIKMKRSFQKKKSHFDVSNNNPRYSMQKKNRKKLLFSAHNTSDLDCLPIRKLYLLLRGDGIVFFRMRCAAS